MEYSKARRLAEIIVRLRIRKVTAEERAFLNDWLDESEANRQTYKRIVRGESIARRLKTEETIQSSTDFAQITEQIARRLTRKHRRPWRIGAWSAAAAIVAATVGYFALFHEPEPAFVPYAMERVVAAATPIADAKVLLVTADGKHPLSYQNPGGVAQSNYLHRRRIFRQAGRRHTSVVECEHGIGVSG